MKTQINLNPITVNFLERGFQNFLLPFRCFQHLVFLSSFSIESNCIRPHSASYYIVSLIAILGFMTIQLIPLFLNDFDVITDKFLLFFIVNIISLVIPFLAFYVLNIIQRQDNVRLILKIQKAFTLTNFKRYKTATIRNWWLIFRHIVGYIISVTATGDLLSAVYFYTLLYFTVNITYAISLIALMRDGIITWISEVEYYSKTSLELEGEKCGDALRKLFQAYINLMDAFDIFKKIFKFTVRVALLKYLIVYIGMSILFSECFLT